MKVSIILPIYNVAEYIHDCICSIIEQTYKDIEVVLVDDCGQDNSIEIALSLLKSHSVNYVLLHHEHNRGLSAARNTGVGAATGEYVYFMDSDDTITPNCIEKLVERIEETEADVVIGDLNINGVAPNVPTLKGEIAESVIEGREDLLNSYMNGNWYVMAWNKLLRRSFLVRNNIQFVEGLVHEDNPWSFEVACSADKIAFVPDKTYNYLVRENSLQTEKDFTKHFDAYMDIIRIVNRIIKNKHLEKQTQYWFERQKALFFSMTLEKGSFRQSKKMYELIHDLKPHCSLSKVNIHYFLPSLFGYYLYKKFYGYNLC